MPLKRSYASEADVPTEQKPLYAQKGDRWELQVEGIDSLDSLLSKRAELLTKVSGHATELAAKDSEISRLQQQVDNANTLPRGHVAVPKADADLLPRYKELGTPEELTTLKTEHGDYKQKAEAAETAQHAAEVAAGMGWDEKTTARLVPKHFDLSKVEVRDGEGGKKVVVAKVEQADKTFVEKPFADVVKATPDLAALLPSLVLKESGTRVPEQRPSDTGKAGNPYDRIREEGEARRKNTREDAIPLERRLNLKERASA